ncbi:AMP-dependent synthetase/ligase [Armatimonas rosea]|uniref:Long-chain acyl-CoA synthetase n=1 Tax=Armatimonas rosea TaxID=685828 RepID=A0A7W9SL73_ARMRO|nr:long-chain fatty acid--CoA ligase [Armatimonas rosea]MBB6048666.1 long-chain acyl-CoA synthetase [Armatimonas rosea]
MTEQTLTRFFQSTVAAHGSAVAMRYRENREWHDITYAELAARVEAIAAGLKSLGVGHGDRVAIYAENQPNWVITDLACHALGAINASIYPTLPPPQVAFIVNDSTAKVLIAGNAKLLANARIAQAECPSLSQLVVMGSVADGDALSFTQLEERGKTHPFGPGEYEASWKGVQPDDIASLIYTSGTTGDPKGAMLTHKNFTSNAINGLALFSKGGVTITADDTFLSFLPLSHSFERIGCYLAIGSGATTAYSEGVKTLADEMKTVQPTVMLCVPRLWEMMQERVLAAAEKAGEMRFAIFTKSLEAAKECIREEQAGRHPSMALNIQRATGEKLVFPKIREEFGGKFRLLVSGGAALNPETALFWRALGMNLVEGYGLTETSPVISINPGHAARIGTVGQVINEGEVKIAPDGEICYRGPNVMKGYWKNEQATRDMIDDEGWLHTGDIGTLSADGYLKITDRKKDIIVLANGKNVSPVPIETKIKNSPFITEVVLIGDKQNTITALVVPNKEKLREAGFTEADDNALLALPEVKKKIKSEIDAHSTALADFEKIKKFTLINAVFSIDTGELTPTLKVKRKVILQKWAKEVAELRGDE